MDPIETETKTAVVLGPGWTQDDTWSYTFMHTATFTCDPDQIEPVPVHWKVTPTSLETLSCLNLRSNPVRTNMELSTFDERMNAKLTKHIGDMYIEIHSLRPDTLSQTASGVAVDWESTRGWFDELVPIYRRRAADLKWAWSDSEMIDERELDDSYFNWDLSQWRNAQQEWKDSLGLSQANYINLDAQLSVILGIEYTNRIDLPGQDEVSK